MPANSTNAKADVISVFVGSPLMRQLRFLQLPRLEVRCAGAVGGREPVGLGDMPEGHPERSQSGTAVSGSQADVSAEAFNSVELLLMGGAL